MNCDYIIIQAGGKGSRMDYLTRNKPKALVPVNNLPMIFHLFRKYPDKYFIIIGDYKIDVLKKYLRSFADVKYLVVDACGKCGTCSGIRDSLELIPDGKSFMLMWSDLILPPEFTLPEKCDNYVGISKDFSCRWKYENGEFIEESSKDQGVAGLFIFKNKDILREVPQEGEFVKWLSNRSILFKELPLYKTKEYGLIEEYHKLEVSKCRPFNRLIVSENTIIKEGIDKQGKELAVREKNWYKKISELKVSYIPKIYSYEPFEMEKIQGGNVYSYHFTFEEKKEVLRKIVNALRKMHEAVTVEADYFSINEAYITKTIKRLNKIRDMIPFADKEIIRINGKECRNIFFHMDELYNKLSSYKVKSFHLIHGDCTFSNIMLNQKLDPVFIDPRGYFGFTELYGDVLYDWAKLYYSIAGNYDRFNLKEFRLYIEKDEVKYTIESNGWEDMEDIFLDMIKEEADVYYIKLIHAIIWLSLTTYAWEDYDSICTAFYNGLYYLEDVL